MPKQFKIPSEAASNPKAGLHAIAAVSEGNVVKLVYLRDLVQEVNEAIAESVDRALHDERIRPAVQMLKPHGQVLVGKCLDDTFVVA